MHKKNNGFSLVELMITVAIIGILASVGYPSYIEHVKKSKRAEAQAALLSFSAAMERHFTVNGSYWNTSNTSNADLTTWKSPKGEIFYDRVPYDASNADAYYYLQLKYTKNEYQLRARPRKSMAGDATFSLQSNGIRNW